MIRIPFFAPCAAPTRMAVGVAIPIAQGHATMTTATNDVMESPKSPVVQYHPAKAMRPAVMTTGVKYDATLSATLWMGAWLSWASSTMWTICWRVVFIPILVTSTFRAPSLFTVPPMTSSPTPFATGMLSPVIMLSSTDEAPSRTSPSRGTLSPGLTIRTSNGMTSSTGTSSSEPSSLRSLAMGG